MKLRPIVWMPSILAAALLAAIPACNNDQAGGRKSETGGKTTGLQPAASGLKPAKVVRPTRGHLKRLSTPQPAHVEPYERTDIHARVAGYLDAIGPALGPDGKPIPDRDGRPRPLDIGDRVAKGQVLAELSVPEMKQELVQKAALVAKARADLGQAKAASQAAEAVAAAARARVEEVSSLVAKYDADVRYRKGEHQRYLTLYEQRAVQGDVVDRELNQLRAAEAALAAANNAVLTARANAKVEDAKLAQAAADEKAAGARLKVAEADLRHAEIMADYATIKAPFEGAITRRLLDPGAFVQSAAAGKPTPLFTLARVDRLRIVAEIPEAEAGLVNKVGQPATFRPNAPGARPLACKVVRFANALDFETRTMRTELEPDTPPQSLPLKGGEGAGGLRPGMFGSVTVLLADFPDALLVPASALVPGDTPAVLVVERGKARQREVELGLREGDRVQVLRGLSGNEQIVADGKAP